MNFNINKTILSEFPENIQNEILKTLEDLKSSYKRIPEKLNSLSKVPLRLGKDKITITNWSEVLSDFNGGDCVDIALMLLRNWKKSGLLNEIRKLDYQVTFAEGTEPQFFNNAEDNHAFILIQKGDIEIIVDPALQVLEELASSGYSIREESTVDEVINIERGRDRIILADNSFRESAILGVTETGEFGIGLTFKVEDKVVVPIIKLFKGKDRIFLDQNSEDQLGSISTHSREEIITILKNLQLLRFE